MTTSPVLVATRAATVPEQVETPRWRPAGRQPAFTPEQLVAVASQVREQLHVVRRSPSSPIGLGVGGHPWSQASADSYELLGTLPPLYPEWLGDRTFAETHRVRFPYVAGEMANGIATTRMVVALGRAQLLGFFGAAGLAPQRVAEAVRELNTQLGHSASWGVNLIHSPNEPEVEERVAELLIDAGVGWISASAFMSLTPAVVRCALAGLRADATGCVVRRRHLFAKVSRVEVAEQFMSPAPPEIVDLLVSRGHITESEAALATRVPVVQDVTVEADSGGHTDNRPLVALLPVVLGLRDTIVARYGYQQAIRVGAAGGLGTPQAVAAAFALGAAYVLTGSVNQIALESGLSDEGKAMLAQADCADVIMAPASDMFELGVKLQVLRRGTMFAPRAARLYEAYLAHQSLEEIPPHVRTRLENEVLHAGFDEIWAETKRFWQARDAAEVARAEADPKHRMALVFRWYLGKSSRWAIQGESSRRADYQIWCGPAMGAFNRWTAGSFLADPQHRSVVQIARNLLEGAAVVTRMQQLRTYGVPVPAAAFHFRPRPLS